ncbi:LacI family DNA-binding transcriptional regulator [Henriciella sp. AS95]|uniref:LacI family DNA-binding transcriptional regulator n=1 Tax=Henriciella sp. AS95 TaxID=3135782 RepID=UPI00317F5CBE
MTKMSDVAEHAGVSIKTVSRVVNHEPHVQDSLRKKVQASIDALGYVPSASARSLRARRSYCIHLISHTLNSNFVHTVQFGALQACQDAGYRMIVSMLDTETSDNDKSLAQWCANLVQESRPDGIILVPPISDNEKINAAIAALEIPTVRIGPNTIVDRNSTVMIDDQAAAREMTEHLISLGHKRIGFVRGKEEQGATHKRFAGYRDALEAAGLPFDPALVQPGLFDFETGLAAGDALLKMDEHPTAVFAANDAMAAGVLVAAHRAGIKVPEQLSIVGFDDAEIAQVMWPALTTVRQPLQELGAEAMHLVTTLAGKSNKTSKPITTCLPYELIERQSTGPA